MSSLYHFTHPGHLASIIAEGVLRTSDSNLDPYDPFVEPRVLWLTDLPVLIDEGTRDGLYAEKRQIRFEVEAPRARRWMDWAPAKTMDQNWKELLLRRSGGMEAAEHWWVSVKPVPRANWKGILHVPSGLSLDPEQADIDPIQNGEAASQFDMDALGKDHIKFDISS